MVFVVYSLEISAALGSRGVRVLARCHRCDPLASNCTRAQFLADERTRNRERGAVDVMDRTDENDQQQRRHAAASVARLMK